jgi:hypothetical protein
MGKADHAAHDDQMIAAIMQAVLAAFKPCQGGRDNGYAIGGQIAFKAVKSGPAAHKSGGKGQLICAKDMDAKRLRRCEYRKSGG